MAHLNYETLLNYMEGHLSVQERSEADAHLSQSCETCQHRLHLIQTTLRAVVEDHTTPPPASVLKRALDIPQAHPKPTLWTRLIASLTFDSHLQLSSALTRGSARERQMLFSAEQLDIDLQIKSAQEKYDLIGQVLGGSDSSVFVSLEAKTGQSLKATETDPHGQFVFRGLSSGQYDLIFNLEDQEIAVLGVEVGND